MNLVAYNPRTNGRVPASFNTLLHEFFADATATRPVRPAMNLLPAADVLETTSAYELHLQLPGFRKEDVKLDLENGRLTVSGERKPEAGEGRAYRLAESCFGAFERTFKLPETVDASQVNASLELGILIIRLPKDTQKTAKHQITIQ